MRMQPLFLIIALASLACASFAFWLGLSYHAGAERIRAAETRGEKLADEERDATGWKLARHFVWAMGSGVFVAFVHSLVLVYFLGTGKAIKERSELENWDDAYRTRSKLLMAKAVIPSVIGILSIIIGAFSGGFTLVRQLPPDAHMAIAAFGICAQIPAYLRQWVLIRENGKLIDEVESRSEARMIQPAL